MVKDGSMATLSVPDHSPAPPLAITAFAVLPTQLNFISNFRLTVGLSR